MVAGSQSVDRYNDRAPELCGEVGDEFPVCGLDFVDVGANVHATGLRSEPSVADDPESSSGRRFATREVTGFIIEGTAGDDARNKTDDALNHCPVTCGADAGID